LFEQLEQLVPLPMSIHLIASPRIITDCNTNVTIELTELPSVVVYGGPIHGQYLNCIHFIPRGIYIQENNIKERCRLS